MTSLASGPGEYTVNMANFINLQYTGPLMFGSPQQGNQDSKFFYDTGTGVAITTGTDCDNSCSTHYYDRNKSRTAQIVESNASLDNLIMGSLNGTYVKDTVCISQTLCVEDWTFFEITSSEHFLEYSGVLGFSPINRTSEHDTSFVKSLYDAGEIPEMIATFQL